MNFKYGNIILFNNFCFSLSYIINYVKAYFKYYLTDKKVTATSGILNSIHSLNSYIASQNIDLQISYYEIFTFVVWTTCMI